MRPAAALLLALTVLMFAAGRVAAEQPGRLTVVELFTSQACSACPPADALLGKLAQRDGILALSYSIDYWNYLEWEDTLAEAAFSERQRAYAKTRGDRKVYTPQLIVNGTVQTVGSKLYRVEAALEEARWREGQPEVLLAIARPDETTLTVEVGAAPDGLETERATVWLVAYDDSRTVTVEAGENKGRTLTYVNVVRRLEPIGKWTGDKLRLTLSLPEIAGRRCAVLLQEGDEVSPGAILAADRPPAQTPTGGRR